MTAHLGLTYSSKIEENLLVTRKYNDNQIVIGIIARQCLLTVNDEKKSMRVISYLFPNNPVD